MEATRPGTTPPHAELPIRNLSLALLAVPRLSGALGLGGLAAAPRHALLAKNDSATEAERTGGVGCPAEQQEHRTSPMHSSAAGHTLAVCMALAFKTRLWSMLCTCSEHLQKKSQRGGLVRDSPSLLFPATVPSGF